MLAGVRCGKIVTGLDGVFLTGFNLFKHFVLGESNWLMGCLLVDAVLTFLGVVFVFWSPTNTAACLFLAIESCSSCFLSPRLDVEVGSELVLDVLVVLFLLVVLIPLSITFTRLIFWPGLWTSSCHFLTF